MRRIGEPDKQVFHVMPVGDLIEHLESTKCLCGPKIEAIQVNDPRSVGVLITHHSLDGREHEEPDHDEEACPICNARASGETP